MGRGVYPVKVGVVYQVKVDDQRSKGEVWRTNQTCWAAWVAAEVRG